MRKLFLASACLSSEGVTRCVHQDGDWVQLEHLISLIWCELFERIIIRKGVKDEASHSDRRKSALLIAAASSAIKWWKLPRPFHLHWSLRCSSGSLSMASACAFSLPLFFYSLERRRCSEAGSLLLIKTHRIYICGFFNPKVTGAYDLSCDTGTTKLSSFTLRSVLPVCSWPKWTDCPENKAERVLGFWGNKYSQEPSARANVDVGEGLSLPFCFPCSDQVNYKCTAYLETTKMHTPVF